ncbi:hypothetical protein Bcav_3277 [Beutenbergia cavernae DSM 12333]|uniref:Uncharacterized protein n=1 Tax=Beutenbergia cavernae (strain ATCC BAA-8 / DSM 12333 / CCUG 43141 / JCM 11478 / NBRC 16432 / NCIMB 13614 / HKI 0122) TaxID=471853 RepID=C5C1B0_BEUC1|nr:hypothetical protein [Beutenbergia cavernae]ACQ81520.1 hypothetical protein Bcav_3277 [Beutenbergia cavernae DSM 12333]
MSQDDTNETADDGDGAQRATTAPVPPEVIRRRRIVVGIGAVVVIALVVVLVLLLTRPDPEPTPGETVAGPTPTPAITPAERDTGTAFLAVLPSTLLQYAVTAQAEDAGLLDAGAVEAWTLTYSDGDGTELVLRTAQLTTPEGAAAARESLTVEGESLRAEPVLVGGEEAGQVVISATEDDGAVAAWSNATAVFQVTGPADAVVAFYDAFGM